MEWKQPEGLRRHWVLEELDGELLFMPLPHGSAQGRFGDEVYDLRDGGVTRKKRVLASGDTILATLEDRPAGGGGILSYAGQQYVWKPASLLGNRWMLQDPQGNTVFTYTSKQGLGRLAKIQMNEVPPETAAPLLLLCWYVTVLS